MYKRREHEICRTKSFSKLQFAYKAPSPQRLSWELLDQAYRSTEQLAAQILAVAKKFEATGHL